MASCRPLGFFTLPVVLILLQMCGIQGSNARPPFSLEHGVPEGNRTELSLSGLEFFGPSAGAEVKNRFPRKSHAEEPAAEPSQAGERLEHSSGDLGERAVAGIVFSFLFLVVFAVGGSYIYVTRRANIRRVDSISSQAVRVDVIDDVDTEHIISSKPGKSLTNKSALANSKHQCPSHHVSAFRKFLSDSKPRSPRKESKRSLPGNLMVARPTTLSTTVESYTYINDAYTCISPILLQIRKRIAFHFDNTRFSSAHIILMGILFNEVNRSDLRAGDHVYSWRTVYTYSHHGTFPALIGSLHSI